jgi:TolB protein
MTRELVSRRRCLAISGSLLLIGLASTTALATLPGDNGSIALRRYLGPERTKSAIFTIAPDGSRGRQVSRPPCQLSDDYPDFAADGSSSPANDAA